MMRKKLDVTLLKYISIFESVTQARVKDCIEDLNGNLIFIVYPGEISKAIGKNGSNVKKVTQLLNKKVRIIEFNSDVEKFITHLLYPIEVDSITVSDNTLTIRDRSREKKSKIIGRESKNLRFLESVLKQYYDIQTIKVE